jgi:hypothetical protein
MFNNQYILTDKKIKAPSASNLYRIGDYNLFTSKEIQVYTSKNNKITLIGYTFHCYSSKTEQEMVDYLSSLENKKLLDEIDNLCGHFILISNKNQLKIYTDACSSFKVFYGKSDKYSFIGSDPKTLCKFHNFTFHTNKEKDTFYKSEYFLKDNTKVGHHTRYKNIYQLVSNHYLLINDLKSERVFPRREREELSMRDASKKLIPIFENILNQMEKKYTIFTSITAGYDSRLLMSSTKKLSNKIQYYTFKLPNTSDNFIDYTIPKSICSDLNLNYSSINIEELDENIKEEVMSTYDLPKLRPFQQYKDIFKENKKPNILLVGFVSEVAKNYLERVKVNNGKDIVRAVHSPDNKYLVNYYQKWINKNQKNIKNYGYEVLDFIHWEQDITNFAGQNTYYAHHYVNLFSIFNSREIMKIMLAVNPDLRDGKDTKFFRYLIEEMWPELLNYPFNPTKKDKIILFMKKVKIYSIYKYLQIKFHKNEEVK